MVAFLLWWHFGLWIFNSYSIHNYNSDNKFDITKTKPENEINGKHNNVRSMAFYSRLCATVIIIIIETIIIIVLLIKKDDIKKHSDYYALIRVSDNIEGLKLLENVVDINATDKEGWTALMDASNKVYLKRVKFFNRKRCGC